MGEKSTPHIISPKKCMPTVNKAMLRKNNDDYPQKRQYLPHYGDIKHQK